MSLRMKGSALIHTHYRKAFVRAYRFCAFSITGQLSFLAEFQIYTYPASCQIQFRFQLEYNKSAW